MRKTARKILSLLLTVALLMGSIALMIPATVLTVSADDYTNITPNTDFIYNGETYRLDVYSGNTESYAHINADGSIEFKIRHGDMIWFPAVQMTETSAVHAEIKSVSSMANFFSGFTYGVKPATAGEHWATAMGAVVCTGNADRSRTRITAGSYANLGNVSGSDRGNGGDQRVDTGAHWVNKSSAWTNVATSSGVWDAGKMITFDITRSGNNVTVAFGSDWGTYDTISYDTTGHSSYAYEGGSVGFAPFWAGTDAYITLTIERLYVTNCTVNGDATDVWSAVGTPILPNADRTINGTTYRFDVVSGHTQSQAFINLDGSITFRISCGDMLWFPGIQMNGDATGTSEIHADITSLVNSTLNFTGLMYGISADGSGRWNYATEALVRTSTRFRIANASYSALSTNGGAANSFVYNDQSNQSAIRATVGWKSVSNTAGTDWGDGKTIGFDVVKTDTTVKVSFMSREAGKIYAHDGYAFNSTYPYAGSVGYGLAWICYNSANSMSYSTLRMDRLTVKNCTVNDEQKDDTYTVVSRAVPPATQKTIVAGQSNMLNEIDARYFHGPAHPYSVAKINPDGTVTMRGWRGDMLWFPNVEIDDESTIHTEILLENDSTVDSSKVCMSTVWNIQTEEEGVWGADSDSCSVASLRTNSRVTVGSTTKYSSYESADYTEAYHNDSSTYDTYDTNSDFGSSWTAGKILIVDISKTGDTVTVTFTNGSNDTLIVEKTYDDSERNTYKGAVGIMSHWNDGFNLFTIQAFTVTNALVNGERRDFDMVSEYASYMSDDYTVRQSLSLDGTIGLNFRLDANFHMPENATLVFSKNDAELYNGAASRYYRGDLGYYRYSVPIVAKEMADSATYNIKIKDGETVVFSQNYSTSVKSYAEALAAANAEWADLMNAMLEYGAAAQQYFGYNTSNLAADISGGITYDASDLDEITADIDYTSFISKAAGTLTLESGTDLNLYLQPKNNNTFTATATNSEFTPVDVTVTKNGGYWQITIADLEAEELGDVFYITVSDGTNSVTFTYNALCWVKAAINSDKTSATTKTLAKAIGVYAAEAQKKK